MTPTSQKAEQIYLLTHILALIYGLTMYNGAWRIALHLNWP